MENLQFRLDLGMKLSFCSASRSCLAMLRLSLKCVETPHGEDDYSEEGTWMAAAGRTISVLSVHHTHLQGHHTNLQSYVAQRGGDSTEA